MENQKTKQIHDVVFTPDYLKTLITNNEIEEAKKYMNKFFFRSGLNTFFYDKIQSEFQLYNETDIKKKVSKDMICKNFEMKKTTVFSCQDYLTSTEFMNVSYYPTIDFKKPLIFAENMEVDDFTISKNYLNMIKPMKMNNFTETISRNGIKEELELIYFHLKNVLCSNKPEQNEFLLNFISCSFNGRKLRKAILMQSNERTGKGQLINGILKSILGARMFKTNSVETIDKYTKPFEGCCLLNFDELPLDGTNYKSISDTLKTLITEPEFSCRSMFQMPYQQTNSFNIIITSNNNCVTLSQTNNTKYVCLDIDESYIGNFEYFDKLAKAINNKEVLIAFYNDMSARFKTLSNWNEDKEMPITNTMQTKIIEALPQFIKFLKQNYVLKNLGINQVTETFLSDYFKASNDKTSKQQVGRYLSGLNIKPIRKNAKDYVYKVSAEELLKSFKAKNWIDELTDKIDYRNSCSELEEDLEQIDNNDETKQELEAVKLQLELFHMMLNIENVINQLKDKDEKQLKKIIELENIVKTQQEEIEKLKTPVKEEFNFEDEFTSALDLL